jgi:hypothetical protein
MADAPPTDLSTLVEPLKRELAVPGEFPSVFPNTSDDDLTGKLGDAFAQAQLYGFFGAQVLDADAATVTPGISSGGGAMVILYAAESVIRAQLRSLKTHEKYESAGSSYEVEQAATVLKAELDALRDRRNDLLALIQRQIRGGRSVYVSDAYVTRAFGYYPSGYFGELGSFYGYELSGLSMLALGG